MLSVLQLIICSLAFTAGGVTGAAFALRTFDVLYLAPKNLQEEDPASEIYYRTWRWPAFRKGRDE